VKVKFGKPIMVQCRKTRADVPVLVNNNTVPSLMWAWQRFALYWVLSSCS